VTTTAHVVAYRAVWASTAKELNSLWIMASQAAEVPPPAVIQSLTSELPAMRAQMSGSASPFQNPIRRGPCLNSIQSHRPRSRSYRAAAAMAMPEVTAARYLLPVPRM